MFCPRCGTQNADGVSFCQNCGSPLSTEQTVSGQEGQNQQYMETEYSRQASASLGLGVMKKACSSPAALVAVIAYTAAALFNLFSAVGGSSGILGYLYQIADALDVDLDYFYYASRGVSVAVGIIGIFAMDSYCLSKESCLIRYYRFQ